MKMMDDKLAKIRKLLTSIRSSVKNCNQFDDVKEKMALKSELPGMDVETRWSSTIEKIWKSFIARRV